MLRIHRTLLQPISPFREPVPGPLSLLTLRQNAFAKVNSSNPQAKLDYCKICLRPRVARTRDLLRRQNEQPMKAALG